MGIPLLKLIGGALLFWIAIKLLVPAEDHGEGSVEAGDTLWKAVRIVAVADIVMSLDNVIAIAAAAATAAARVEMANAATIEAVLIIVRLASSLLLIVGG